MIESPIPMPIQANMAMHGIWQNTDVQNITFHLKSLNTPVSFQKASGDTFNGIFILGPCIFYSFQSTGGVLENISIDDIAKFDLVKSNDAKAASPVPAVPPAPFQAIE
jgi:hypothetical protein